MARKLFYMIRHGESILNSEHIRQGAEGSLSALGMEQALNTGKHLEKIKFDAVLISPFTRTRETADLILKYVKVSKQPEYLDLLKERKNPSEIVNQSGDDPKIKEIVDLIDKSFHKDDFRYSDEENFSDLKKRAIELLDYLSKREEKKVLVITHSIFLKMVAACVEVGPNLTAEKYNLLSFLNTSNNASVSIFEYNNGFLGGSWLGNLFPKKENSWKILVWDEYIHPPKY